MVGRGDFFSLSPKKLDVCLNVFFSVSRGKIENVTGGSSNVYAPEFNQNLVSINQISSINFNKLGQKFFKNLFE